MIYLDCNATTPLDREVKKAMEDAFGVFGNPSSSHSIGRAAKAVIDKAREQVARLIRSEPAEIIFTSGGTESNNLAIIGTAYKYRQGHIITSSIEHPSVLNPLKWLQDKGFEVTCLPVDLHGMVSPDDVRRAIKRNTILITIMHSNNETGVLQPIEEIGRIARECNVVFHSDAAQSVGKRKVNVRELMADMLTVVSHKFYGPKGIGALYIKNDVSVAPIMFGAGHERGIRPGTENITGISGFGKACEIAVRDMHNRCEYVRLLRDMLFASLKERIDIKLNGHEILRLPNTLNISVDGIIGEELVEALKDKIAFSSGSACHAGLKRPSAVLKLMGLSDADALSSIRLSVGKDNAVDEIRTASETIIMAANELQGK
ncbi:MAG: cysteine desulfurase family protein [Thermodesulfovibrionales bacterium]|nr:cysteine desulfurase family protein [Thermodesulfovibrionales bacterium]